MDDRLRQQDFTRTPQIILHRIDFLHRYVKKGETLVDLAFCSQERKFGLDQGQPEPLKTTEEQEELEHQQIKEEPDKLEYQQIKEEEKEFCISQDEEQLLLKQETETFMVTSFSDEHDPSSNRYFIKDAPEADSQDQKESKRDEELKQNQKNRHVDNSKRKVVFLMSPGSLSMFDNSLKMSPVQPQREMMNEPLTPAEETFTEFNGIIVKSEEELDGQRRLLDFSRIPLIILHRIDQDRRAWRGII
ncbi:hypothetical protein CHARACLAT_022417 [Characodon lateralis]|uniref:Uncharacterized protein n=1 Tax=Characodon lateralis TaxID=208331 RepID=A0ABU7D943_9TELE|nr:hypothetical protein [Characodon lateralis]